MANHLRPIALTVDEPSPGLFHWALLASSSGPPLFDRPVLAAGDPYDSFEKAARAGLMNWTRMAGDDPRSGPRSRDESAPLEPTPGPWTAGQRSNTAA
jgi:hypothetical protein